MKDYHEQAIDTLLDRPELLQALGEMRNFLADFPAEEVAKWGWQLLYTAFSSEQADKWTAAERAEKLSFYYQLNKLLPALESLEKEMALLFRTQQTNNHNVQNL